MLTFERRLAGLLRYRKIFFSPREAALEIGRSMAMNEVVRFFAADCELAGLANVVRHHAMLTTHLDLSVGPQQLLRAMKKKSCRYEIQRAQKLGAVEIERNSPRALRDFLPLYNAFAKAKGPVPVLSLRQFQEFLAHGDAFVLYYQQQPACCHLFLRDMQARTVRLLYSGSSRFKSSRDASACGALNRFLHWHAMQQYHAEGIRTYDFGGIRNLAHPTARFKLSFGGSVETEHYYLCGGTAWLAKLGGALYERWFKSAAPSLSAQ
jgi:Acetyltransferase (GNAT) domain